MNSDDPLALALSEWQRKHHISDGDPLIAVLELVRLAVRHPQKSDCPEASPPPTFEEFRTTIETLDARSKSFVSQSTDLIAEMRRLAQTVQKLNEKQSGGLLMAVLFAMAAGVGIGWVLWRSSLL
jgi:hypothetical protein